MQKKFDLNSYPVKNCLKNLLKDNTSGGNIIFASDEYLKYDKNADKKSQITIEFLNKFGDKAIRPRFTKTAEHQSSRTKENAEVFTPAWVCNKMIGYCDEDWFGRKNVFTSSKKKVDIETRQVNKNKIKFDEKTWQDFVKTKYCEITCGEAPFLTSRYDSSTGKDINIERRIGVIDRKLRVDNENIDDEKQWLNYAYEAYKATYGYEFQGDNLLIARINLLLTFCENLQYKFNREATNDELDKICNILSWNIVQMDGLKNVIPFNEDKQQGTQFSLFDELSETADSDVKIYNWNINKSMMFKNLGKGANMKFDYCIGNPPYQENVADNGRQPPVYHYFYDSSFKIADSSLLITPGRFLFNAGQTPKDWNKKMLNNKHIKVLFYEPKSNEVFVNTDIKGGIVIVYQSNFIEQRPIKVFSKHSEMIEIFSKVSSFDDFKSLSEIISSQGLFKFSNKFFDDCPFAKDVIGKGTRNKIVSKAVGELDSVFFENKDKLNCKTYKVVARINSKKQIRYIDSSYVIEPFDLNTFSAFIPEANNSGRFGEKISLPIVGEKFQICSDTYLYCGPFSSKEEAIAFRKYFATKFFRSLLGINKVTQHCPPEVWKCIPMQNFSTNSDINWSKSISDIDQQLFKKYNLNDNEVDFIESHVKEME